MLKTYEAILNYDHIHWMADHPTFHTARAIITILPDKAEPKTLSRKRFPPQFANQVKETGNIMITLSSKDWGLE